MAKEIFRRYIWLVDTIRRGKGLTFEEINNAWQRSCLNEYGTELSKEHLEIGSMHCQPHSEFGLNVPEKHRSNIILWKMRVTITT